MIVVGLWKPQGSECQSNLWFYSSKNASGVESKISKNQIPMKNQLSSLVGLGAIPADESKRYAILLDNHFDTVRGLSTSISLFFSVKVSNVTKFT